MDDDVLMEILVNSGNARSLAIEALRAAAQGNFAEADEKLKEADEVMVEAHEHQTELIQGEINGTKKTEISLIVVHSQDHLMCGMAVIDLCKEMVEILRAKA